MRLLSVQDGTAMLWDLAEGKRLYNLDAGEIIYALCFSPNRYWLCAATTNVIKVRLLGISGSLTLLKMHTGVIIKWTDLNGTLSGRTL